MVLKRNLLTLAVASILASAVAHAQNAPAQPDAANAAEQESPKKPGEATKADENITEFGEIKVTGVRAAIERAVSVKQNSNEIVEAISAEDIGKLPDNSIAESIARLPGLAAQRVAGRAQTISVRGFSGDFVGTLLNGREQVSTGDNRSVEYDQYPSELLSGVVVYKTPSANLVGQGLAGTVDMQTVRPLDYSKRTVSLGIRGETNSNGSLNPDTDSKGYRLNASYIDQFLDHTLGVAVGYARLNSPTQGERWEAWGYPTNPVGDKPNVVELGGGKAYDDSAKNQRDALMGTVQWKPNESYVSTLDIYYSKFTQDTTSRGFEVGLPWGAEKLINPVIENNILVGGTWLGAKPVIRNDLNTRKDYIRTLGWNNKLEVGDHWILMGDLSYSKAKRKESILETYAGTVPGTPGAKDYFNFSMDPSTGLPHFNTGLNYADPKIIKLTDAGGWGQDGYVKFPHVSDELKQARFDVSRDFNSFISKIDFGVDYTNREKTREVPEFFVNLVKGVNLPDGSRNWTEIPPGSLSGPAYFGYVGLPGGVISYDANGLLNAPACWNGSPSSNLTYGCIQNKHKDITNKDWTVKEKVGTAYLMANFDTEVAGMPLRGNLGGQYVHTDQSSTAFALERGDPNAALPFTAGRKYNDFLPNLNIALTLPLEQILRFGAAKEMARPRLDQLRASNNYSLDFVKDPSPLDKTLTTCTSVAQGAKVPCHWTGDGGNPKLDPFRADAYDLSYEKYWESKAYVSAALFYKKLESSVLQGSTYKDYAGLPNPSQDLSSPGTTIGTYSTPINLQGGYMRGYELAASLPLDVLWQAADGFGVVAGYAHTESSINYPDPDTGTLSPISFPGLSKDVWSVTGYFEKAGFQARIAQRYRSDFIGEVTGFGADRRFEHIKAETITDAQVGYEIQNGSWQGVSFLLQINNMFNKPYRSFYTYPDGDPRGPSQPKAYTLYGRQVLLGVNYKF